MNPATLAIQLNKWWLDRYGPGSMSGNCGKIAIMLARRIPNAVLVSGTFRGHPGNHAWIECDGQILDPSVSQYGDYPVVGDPANYLPRTKTRNPT